MAVSGDDTDRDAVPQGMADLAVEVTRSDEALTVVVPDDPAPSNRVAMCPGLLPGPSDAAGVLERIRVSGCVDMTQDPATAGAWTLAFDALDAERIVAFDAAERWLAVVIDLDAAPDAPDRIAGAWVAGGPLLPTGPLLP